MMVIDIICLTALTIGILGITIEEHQNKKKEKEKKKERK